MSDMPEKILVIQAQQIGNEWRGYCEGHEPELWGESEDDVFYVLKALADEREAALKAENERLKKRLELAREALYEAGREGGRLDKASAIAIADLCQATIAAIEQEDE